MTKRGALNLRSADPDFANCDSLGDESSDSRSRVSRMSVAAWVLVGISNAACSETSRNFAIADEESTGSNIPIDAGGRPTPESNNDGGPAIDAGLLLSCEADQACDDGNACNGAEACVDNRCEAGSFAEDGTSCELVVGDDIAHFCIAGNCRPTRCGDGVVDNNNAEVCDDGNSTSGDGCDSDCQLSCESDLDCDDSNICNGDETCAAEGTCNAGLPLEDGVNCGPDRNCNNGRCVPVGCGDGVQSGNEQCDDGNLVDADGCDSDCTFTCETDEQCDDLNSCNGKETCNLEAHICEVGTPIDCDDGSDCTRDSCEPESGACVNALIDEDGDQHASRDLGACGDDCDDQDPQVFTGAEELCDNKDNNCNGQTDETAPTWYLDCDGDGFAAAGAVSTQQCEQPSPPIDFCERGQASQWVALAPASGAIDCYDGSPEVRPMTAAESNATWSSIPIDGQSSQFDFDYNCDTVEEQRYTVGGLNPNYSGNCGLIIAPPIDPLLYHQITPGFCPGPAGYTGEPPACGKSGTWTYCKADCSRTTRSQVQQCR